MTTSKLLSSTGYLSAQKRTAAFVFHFFGYHISGAFLSSGETVTAEWFPDINMTILGLWSLMAKVTNQCILFSLFSVQMLLRPLSILFFPQTSRLDSFAFCGYFLVMWRHVTCPFSLLGLYSAFPGISRAFRLRETFWERLKVKSCRLRPRRVWVTGCGVVPSECCAICDVVMMPTVGVSQSELRGTSTQVKPRKPLSVTWLLGPFVFLLLKTTS